MWRILNVISINGNYILKLENDRKAAYKSVNLPPQDTLDFCDRGKPDYMPIFISHTFSYFVKLNLNTNQ